MGWTDHFKKRLNEAREQKDLSSYVHLMTKIKTNLDHLNHRINSEKRQLIQIKEIHQNLEKDHQALIENLEIEKEIAKDLYDVAKKGIPTKKRKKSSKKKGK